VIWFSSDWNATGTLIVTGTGSATPSSAK
jgi:hypothetical protein